MFPFFNNYPGTDLHEIDLAYILKVCSDTVDKVREQDDKIAAVEQLAADLQDFVNNYFDNLDVQTEINNKIDRMAANGALLAIIEEPVTDAAAAWLAQHLTPTTPPVDDTLTVSGAAADAKVTGDKITELKNDFNNTIIVSPSLNLLDPNNITVGYYYKPATVDGRSVLQLTENAAFSCAYIDITPGETYSLTGTSYASYTGDADGYAIGIANSTTTNIADPEIDSSAVESRYNNTDKTITRLYFSWRPATYPTNRYMANKGSLLPYVPYTGNTSNLLNPNNITVGYYYKPATVDGRSVLQLTENAAFSCAYIDITPGETYSLTGTSYASYTGDADGYAIGIANSTTTSIANPTINSSAVESRYNNTDKTITRLYFSWRPATYPTNRYMANKGSLLPYVPYDPYAGYTRSLASDVKVPLNNIEEETYIVDINGSGDFTSLMNAFVTLKDNEKSKTIYVLSGEYNIFSEIGGYTFVNSIPSDATNYWDYITVVPKNTKVIGVGGVVLNYLPESVPDIAAQFISPINVSDGDFYMENIKIVCKNCRYGIHDQTRTENTKGYKHIYKNISVLKDSANGYTGKAQAFGGGMVKSTEFLFESCVFQSNRNAWSLHNAHAGSGDIVIRNCAFKNLITTRNAYPSIRFGNVSGVQTHVQVNLSGCYLNDGIKVGNESSAERPNAFEINMINCIGNTAITIENQTNIYTPQVFNG